MKKFINLQIKNPPIGGFVYKTNYFGLADLSLDFVTSSACGGGTYSGGLLLLMICP